MARIPLQSLVSARQSGIAIQPGVFQQTADATAGLLSSVAGGVEMVKAQFDKAQDIHNQSAISEGRRKFRDAQGEFQNRMLDKKFSPDQWGPEWQDTLKGLEAEIGLNDSKMPPVVSRALGEDFQNFAGSSFIQISGAALKENLKRGRQNLQRDTQYMRETGDHDGAIGLLNEAVESGVLTEEVAKDEIRAVQYEAQSDNILMERITNPHEHLIAVTDGAYPNLSGPQRQQELDATQRVLDNLEDVAVTSIQDESDQGGFLTDKKSTREEKIKAALEANPDIGPKTVKKIMAGINATKVLSVGEMQEMSRRVDGLFDLRDNPAAYATEWHKIRVDVMAQRQRDGMGGFSSALSTQHPSRFTHEANKARAATGETKEKKSIAAVGRALISEFATASAEIRVLETEVDLAVLGDGARPKDVDIYNKKNESKIDTRAIIIKKLMQDAVDDFISDFDGTPTATEVSEFINKNGDTIRADASMEKFGEGDVEAPAKTLEERAASFPPTPPPQPPAKKKSKRRLNEDGPRLEDTFLHPISE